MAKELTGVRLSQETIFQLKERELHKRDAIILGINSYDNNKYDEPINCNEQLESLIGFVKNNNGKPYSKELYYVLKLVGVQIELLSNFNIKIEDKSKHDMLIFQIKVLSKKYESVVR